MKTTKKIVGYCAVDSGQILFTDPCYLNKWQDNDYQEGFLESPAPFSYNGACHATLSDDMAGSVGHDGTGVAVSTGYGDGLYPVTATYQDCGEFGKRIKSVTIKFF